MQLFKYLAVVLILTATLANAQTIDCNDVPAIINTMQQKLDSTTSYQFNIKAEFKGELLSASEIFGKRPDLLKAILTAENNQSITVIFNKQFQWIDDGESVYQLNLSKIDRDMQYPFNTPYSLAGNGLFDGEDYVGTFKNLLTIYDYTSSCKEGQIILKGKLNIKKATQYMKTKNIAAPLNRFVQQFNTLFGVATVIINAKDYLVTSYALTGKDKSVVFNVSITNYKFDGLPDSFFDYHIPQGKIPVDITPEEEKGEGIDK